MEHNLQIVIDYIVILIFALANAAFPLNSQKLVQVFLNPVNLWFITEMVIGKLLGIAGFMWIAVKSGLYAYCHQI